MSGRLIWPVSSFKVGLEPSPAILAATRGKTAKEASEMNEGQGRRESSKIRVWVSRKRAMAVAVVKCVVAKQSGANDVGIDSVEIWSLD